MQACRSLHAWQTGRGRLRDEPMSRFTCPLLKIAFPNRRAAGNVISSAPRRRGARICTWLSQDQTPFTAGHGVPYGGGVAASERCSSSYGADLRLVSLTKEM